MKKALLLSVGLAFAVMLTVGPSKASAIEKAPVKTEYVALVKKYSAPVVNLNVDAEFSPIIFEIVTASVIERPYFMYKYAVLSNEMEVPRGPPEFRC